MILQNFTYSLAKHTRNQNNLLF
uniref:Uncharacterized protein n=1 Tax=Anguilla anguilla TaxID=7936 RepID=A0A0E9RCW0_ANGAN